MSLLNGRLRIFQMAASLRHFSEAASALGMSQPNVTQQMAALERELNVSLFDRAQRQLALTPAGEALLAECDHLFAETRDIERRIRNASGGIQHRLLGGTMTAGGYLLPELAAVYMSRTPSCKVGIRVGNTSEISELLKTRSLDLALVEGPFDRGHFLSKRFCEDTLYPVAAPGTLPERFSLAEYLHDGGRFVLREAGSGTRWYFDLFLKKNNLPAPPASSLLEVNSFDAIKNLVRGGHGITVISELAVRDEVAAGQLSQLHFQEGEIKRGIDFIYTATDTRFAEAFIRFCLAVGPNGGGGGRTTSLERRQ